MASHRSDVCFSCEQFSGLFHQMLHIMLSLYYQFSELKTKTLNGWMKMHLQIQVSRHRLTFYTTVLFELTGQEIFHANNLKLRHPVTLTTYLLPLFAQPPKMNNAIKLEVLFRVCFRSQANCANASQTGCRRPINDTQGLLFE